jgi:hypothetical protein
MGIINPMISPTSIEYPPGAVYILNDGQGWE